ncbi:hypothetical protein [Paenibacillus sp. sgz500958]|uniref:hypothetical protein n=1 Tax=Paenibacillus sp. sgz500958 TaxID=3242475 RepID=UPI0036D2E1EE
MPQTQMYSAFANSRQTELAGDINAIQTTITVLDGSVLPNPPNMLTLSPAGESAETILYTGKTGNNLTGVTRGIDGTNAQSWTAGTKIARMFTAADHEAFRQNIADHETRIVAVKATADAAETPAGAQAKVNAHIADNAKHVPHIGTTTNSGNAYSVTTTETISANQKFTVKFNTASTGAATLNINASGAKAIKKAGGTDATLKIGVYTLFYDGTNFQLLGEGGEYGDATADKVLAPNTIGTDTGIVVGTMPNNGALGTITPSTSNQNIPAGYTSGGTVLGDPDLIPANVLTTANIFGIQGMAPAIKKNDVAARALFASGFGTTVTQLAYNGDADRLVLLGVPEAGNHRIYGLRDGAQVFTSAALSASQSVCLWVVRNGSYCIAATNNYVHKVPVSVGGSNVAPTWSRILTNSLSTMCGLLELGDGTIVTAGGNYLEITSSSGVFVKNISVTYAIQTMCSDPTDPDIVYVHLSDYSVKKIRISTSAVVWTRASMSLYTGRQLIYYKGYIYGTTAGQTAFKLSAVDGSVVIAETNVTTVHSGFMFDKFDNLFTVDNSVPNNNYGLKWCGTETFTSTKYTVTDLIHASSNCYSKIITDNNMGVAFGNNVLTVFEFKYGLQ